MSTPLIREYDLQVSTPECTPGAVWYRVRIDLVDDIAEALPYLNAELEGAEYDHSISVLLWTGDGKRYAFRSREIAIAPVESREEAQSVVDRMVAAVNDIWNRRDRIQPDFGGRKALPNALDIYRLLPGTNCGECGCPTCMAFATALRTDPTKLSLCRYLSEQEYISVLPEDVRT
jgi:ArsR family metal-binding transcriptional regulator